MANEPLGTSYEAACGDEGKGGRAATLNGLFDEWNDQRRGKPGEQGKIARYGTIDWLFQSRFRLSEQILRVDKWSLCRD
jgi:hypothetical protein